MNVLNLLSIYHHSGPYAFDCCTTTSCSLQSIFGPHLHFLSYAFPSPMLTSNLIFTYHSLLSFLSALTATLLVFPQFYFTSSTHGCIFFYPGKGERVIIFIRHTYTNTFLIVKNSNEL